MAWKRASLVGKLRLLSHLLPCPSCRRPNQVESAELSLVLLLLFCLLVLLLLLQLLHLLVLLLLLLLQLPVHAKKPATLLPVLPERHGESGRWNRANDCKCHDAEKGSCFHHGAEIREAGAGGDVVCKGGVRCYASSRFCVTQKVAS